MANVLIKVYKSIWNNNLVATGDVVNISSVSVSVSVRKLESVKVSNELEIIETENSYGLIIIAKLCPSISP